jgi:MoxR-like ATPase
MSSAREEAQSAELRGKANGIRDDLQRMIHELEKVIVGHREVIEGILISLLCGGHVLLEGVPGLGKTLLVKSLGRVLNLRFSRIQFTPDLMPADIIGTNVVMEDESGRKHFEFQRGPVFAQVILADEINRATPKTQSALLEAMQERSVTVAGIAHRLEAPFIVLATQNPIEMEGTYPLPEAQLDRFFLKLNVTYPSIQQLEDIVERTTQHDAAELQNVLDAERVAEMKDFVRSIPVAAHVKNYAARLVLATHPDSPYATDLATRYVMYGSSPRGAQSLVLGGKMKALLEGRYNVSFEDIRTIAIPSLRHRVILNFEGAAAGIEQASIVAEILEKTPEVVRGS